MTHRHKNLAARLLAFAAFACAGVAVQADAPTTKPTARSGHAQVSLISDASSIAPGKPFTVALKFEMDPEWHIYWKDPGDSGQEPRVKWSLPPGFSAGELTYPAPEVLKTPAGTNYVYHGDVALLVQITPPADLAVGSPVPIALNLNWLECDADRCIPAKAPLAVTLTAAAEPVANEVEAFKGWQAKVEAGKSFDPKAGAGASAAH